MKFRTQLTAACLLFLCVFSMTQNAYSKQQKPNIVFIIGDDLERDMFNCIPEGKGKNLTPNIDRIAKEGIIFPQAHCVSPACTPSRFNVLTGKYASRANGNSIKNSLNQHGMPIIGWNTHITEGDITLPRLLQEAGYKTGFVGKNHTIECHGYNRNIKKNADPTDSEVKAKLKKNAEKIEQAIKDAGFDYAASVYHNNPVQLKPSKLAVHNTDWVTKGGLDFIDEYKDETFFLYFAPTLTHAPYQPNTSWDAGRRATPEGMLDEPFNVIPESSTITRRLQKAGITTSNHKHRAHILQFDDAIGALWDKLEQHDLLDNTPIVLCTDHGVENGKSSVYEGGTLSMSMMWRKGGFPAGSVSEALLSYVDFAPTLLDYVGAEVSEGLFDWKSFLPIINGEAKDIHESVYFEMGCSRGIQIKNLKYIAVRYPDSINDPFENEIGQVSLRSPISNLEKKAMEHHPAYFEADQLYDLSEDPTEQNNLANNPEYEGIMAIMKQKLTEYVSDLPGEFGEF
jgi:arylsulfatase A-like enzyme